MTPELKAAFRWHMQRGARAKRALELAHIDVAAGKRRYPAPMKPGPAVSWQPGRPGIAYVEDPSKAGLRYVGRVQADTPRGNIWDSRDSSGWFTDPYWSDLCYGVVYQLPARDGKARFVAGYQMGDEDGGPTLDLGEIYEEPRGDCYAAPQDLDAARDAARAADSMAQHAAEEERDYQTAWQAGSDYLDASNDLATIRAEIRGILQERRQAMHNAALTDSGYFALCDAIRKRVADLLEDMHKRRRVMRELASGDHDSLIFWSGDKRLQESFCEGAGIDKFPA